MVRATHALGIVGAAEDTGYGSGLRSGFRGTKKDDIVGCGGKRRKLEERGKEGIGDASANG